MYWFRKAVPKALQAQVGEVLGRPGKPARELKWTLGTHDPAEAKRLMPAATLKADGILEAARTGARPLTARELHALAGLWYRRTLEAWEADPAKAAAWEGWEVTWPVSGGDGPDADPNVTREWDRFAADFLPRAVELLRQESVTTDLESKRHLALLLTSRLAQARAVFARRQAGDYRRDRLPEQFPEWTPPAADGVTFSAPNVPLQTLLKGWEAVAVTKPRTVAETRYAVQNLETFLGHGDAARITREDLTRWRDSMKTAGKTNNTWNNRLSLIRQVLLHGVAERSLKEDVTEGLRLRKNRSKSPLPYTDAEASTILQAARKETRPSLRWAHWVMAFTGMRAGEVLQLAGGDVREENGIWFIDVHEDTPGNSVKTSTRRHVPVHPALIAEGFVSFAEKVAPKAPLFPDKKVDAFGQRGGRAWNLVGAWVRDKVGITDPQKAPDHSWRHRVEDELRAAEVPEDARDAIVGHARKTTGKVYGVRGEALGRLHRYLSKVPVPPGLNVGAVDGSAAA